MEHNPEIPLESKLVDVEYINAVRLIHDDQNIIEVLLRIIQDQDFFSDILIHQEKPIVIRETKKLREITEWNVSREQMEELFGRLDENWQENIKIRACDKALKLTNCRIRVNYFQFLGGQNLGAIIRIFPLEPFSFEQIGLHQNAISLSNMDSGLLLVVGDTCQGKSTTLASIINNINIHRSAHILTIEDPIETLVPNQTSIVTQREIGSDVESFYMGARDALRERPDVIMFGEIRDSQTAVEALMLAESGPLVLGSLHAKSVEQAITKFARLLGNEDHQRKALASSLRGIICQCLIPLANENKYVLVTEVFKNGTQFMQDIENQNLKNIRSKLKTASEEMDNAGSHTMNKELLPLVINKKIHIEDAYKASTDIDDLREKYKRESSR